MSCIHSDKSVSDKIYITLRACESVSIREICVNSLGVDAVIRVEKWLQPLEQLQETVEYPNSNNCFNQWFNFCVFIICLCLSACVDGFLN